MTHDEKLRDIQEHPENHRHDWNDLQGCCLVENAFDPQLMEAHPRITIAGRPWGGRKCDVLEGPCACGGWH